MADEEQTAREPRDYAVLVRVAHVDPEREAWRELGVVQATNRRGAKDAALAKWPQEMTPSNGHEVVAHFVPARSWQPATGKHEQAPAPPPKVTWEGL